MEEKTKLQEQEAPLKNNDNAFVQVSLNGEPVMPEPTEKEKNPPRQNGRDAVPDRQ